MKKLFLFLMAICMSFATMSQNLKPIAKKITEKKQRMEEFVPVTLFNLTPSSRQKANELTGVVNNSTVLEFRKSEAQIILTTHPANISLVIPSVNGNVEVELFQSNIFTPDFSVTTSGNNGRSVAYNGGAHYWGIVKGDNTSLAAISIYDDEVMGLITSPLYGNLVLGKLDNDAKGDHIFYNDKNLIGRPPMECGTINDDSKYEAYQLQNPEQVMVNCIRLFWEVNYDIYQGKGSVANAANYVIGLFNQSAIIYSNDAITVELSEVYVWNTTSPYTGSTTSAQLGLFQSTRNSINGDLGHLLGYTGGGGIAAGFSGICNANLDASQCYSMIYSTFSNVPTYSWSVMVVTHEQGHLMGSRHTHACVWNGNNTAIDGCGPSAGYGYEGSCSGAPIPAGGGTIMSYCHLNAVGINLSLGFGTQPKNVIINNYNNGACLTACLGTSCMPSANMSTANILSNTATFNWDAAVNATGYNIRYRVIGSGTWLTGTSATTSYSAAGLTPGSNYEWQVQTVCAGGTSIFTISTNFTTQPLTCLPPTSPSTSNITSSSATFNWVAASGATNYTIQYRIVGAGSWITTTSASTSVNVFSLAASSNYEWQIQSTCSGGGTSSFSSSVNFTTPAPPCNVPQNNFTTNVTDVSATLNWGGAGGSSGSSYNLRYRIVGAAIWTNTTSLASPLVISGLTPLSNYEWQVQTVCGLTTSSFSSSVPFTTLCSTPTASITAGGATTFCAGGSVTLTASAGAGYSYQWLLNNNPINGATIQTYSASTSGSYMVTVTSGTCSLTSSAIVITVNPVPTPTIIGSGAFCAGSSTTLDAGAGYSSYAWSNGATTQSLNVTTAGTFTVTVTSANSCTGSASAITTVNASPAPSITGGTTFCAGSSTTLDAGSGYSSYAWSNGATTQSISVNAAGPFSVTVTNANGCGGSASVATTVNPTPLPIISGPTSFCPGSSTSLDAGSGYSNYAWSNGATTQSINVNTAGIFTVTVTNGSGCTGSASVTTSLGNLTAGVTPSGTVVLCSGSSTVLSATAGTGYSYQWYRNNVVLATATGQSFTTSTAGTYKCVVSSASCSATTNSVVISVINNPTATFTYNSPLSFCSPGSVTFTANSYAGVVYQWENNNVAIAGATSVSYVATTAGQYRVKQTANGCDKYSGKVTVSTASIPAAAISTNDPTTLCAAGTVTMNVTSPVPGYNYQWQNNGLNIAGATGTSYGATASGNYTVKATASCGTGTSNSISVSIGSFNAQVSPSGTAALCSGGSLTLSANTGTGFSYQWMNNGVNIAGATGSTLTVSNSGSYSVFMSSACGTATSAATTVTIASVTASVTPAGSSTVCSGTSITYTANVGSGYTYRWYRNNVLLAATTQSFTTSTAGSYKVEVSVSGSCPVQSNTVVLTVTNNPTATVTAGGPTTFCTGQSVTLTTNSYAGVSYQWQKNSTNIAGATGQSYTATTTGSYRVQHTANGCSKYSAQNAVSVTNCARVGGQLQIGAEARILITPNPFSNTATIQVDENIELVNATMEVYNLLGNVVKHMSNISSNNITLEKDKLQSGVYQLRIVNADGQMINSRFVIK